MGKVPHVILLPRVIDPMQKQNNRARSQVGAEVVGLVAWGELLAVPLEGEVAPVLGGDELPSAWKRRRLAAQETREGGHVPIQCVEPCTEDRLVLAGQQGHDGLRMLVSLAMHPQPPACGGLAVEEAQKDQRRGCASLVRPRGLLAAFLELLQKSEDLLRPGGCSG